MILHALIIIGILIAACFLLITMHKAITNAQVKEIERKHKYNSYIKRAARAYMNFDKDEK